MSSLILASASPQRKQLLANIGLQFDVIPSTVNERSCVESDPAERSLILARMKAQDVASKNPDAYVIGCDTLVVTSDGTLLEKPMNEKEAREMLAKHSGKTCTVHSGLCLVSPNKSLHEGISSSAVTFKKLSPEEIDWWISTGLWQDRSGAFQIDGPGQLMIERMDGDFTGVVGLPVFLLGKLLNEAGFSLIQ